MVRFLLGLLLALPALAQTPVRFTDSAGHIITAGDNTNNAIRVNCVTGCTGGGGGGTSSNFGAAFPAAGTAAGASDGVNMQPLLVDGSGYLKTVISAALPAGANVIGHVIADSGSTTAVTGNVTVVQGTGSNLHAVLDSGSTTAVTQATASSLNAQVVGAAASGAAKAGNPVQIGGVFNTTQPTVTNGQAVEVQATARGAQIVATGVDTFHATLDSGSTTTVTQGTGSNLHVVLDSGTLTSITNAVTVSQGTGTNLHTVTDSGSVTAATLSAETTKVIGTVRILGNGGATLDSTVGPGTAPTNAQAVSGLYNNTPPAPTTGQALAVQLDQAGNLRNLPGISMATLSAWTSATSLNATQTIFSNSGAESVLVQLTQTTTLTAGAITFECSFDNSTWVTCPANQIIDPTSTTYATISIPYTVQASTNKYFLIPSNGWQGLRIKLSTQITGTGSVTPNYALLAYSPIEAVTMYGTGSVNVAQIAGTTALTGNGVTGAGSLRVTIASDNTAFAVNSTLSAETTKVIGTVRLLGNGGATLDSAPAATAPTNVLQVGGTFTTSPTTLTSGQAGALQLTAAQNLKTDMTTIAGTTTLTGNGTTGAGSQRVTIASDNTAFTVNAAESGAWTVQPGNTANTTPWLVQNVPGTANGLTWFNLEPAASDNHTNIKNGAGVVYHVMVTNKSANLQYIRLYNAATGFNGCNSATNLVWSGIIPGNATNGGGFVEDIGMGITFSTGISVCVSGAYGQTDTTAATASAMEVNIGYK